MRSWGLVKVSVADVRRDPDQRSEQVTQAILGMVLEELDRRDNWLRVRLSDGYIGWVHESLVQRGDDKLIERWSTGPKVMITSPVTRILSNRHRTAVPVSDAVIGTELLLLKPGRRWSRVALPDGRAGWVEHHDTADEADLIHLQGGSTEEILRTARSFTGLPYLWGGNTPKGFDCSGFVQTVFRLNGLLLPRDACQQFACGRDVHSRNELRAADLLFFRGEGADRITHVAIHILGGQFIHCSGYVRVSSLERQAEDYDASLERQYAGAKRVLGGKPSEC